MIYRLALMLAAVGFALFSATAAIARTEQSIRDVPVSVAVFTEELDAGVTNLEDLTQRIPGVTLDTVGLDGGGAVIHIRGLNASQTGTGLVQLNGRPLDQFMNGLADLDAVEVLRGPQGTLFGRNAAASVVCRNAQDTYTLASNAAIEGQQNLSDQLLELAGGTLDPMRHRVHGGPPATPEMLLEGVELPWLKLDELTPAAAFTVEILVELASEGRGPIFFEEVDECDRWVVAIGPSVLPTQLAGGTRPADPVPERPRDPIPEKPFDPTHEEEEDEEEEGCCGFIVKRTVLKDGLEAVAQKEEKTNLIAYPVTTEYMQLENPLHPLPATHDPAIAAFNVQLNSGSLFFSEQADLHVKARAMDVLFRRTYSGDVVTDKGGILGHRWDFTLNKRIVPMPQTPAQQGQYIEPVNAKTGVLYGDGYGRVERYEFLDYDHRRVRNFGFPGEAMAFFTAHVTTYKSPPGAFHEIQRYVLDDPQSHPFARHPNVHVELGEAIFYVLRTKQHYQYVFNCRGQLIYVFDRHRNFHELQYDETRINPITHNPLLVTLVDTLRRQYEFKYNDKINQGSYLTNLNCEVKQGDNVPVYKLAQVIDPHGRQVELAYGNNATLQHAAFKAGPTVIQRGYRYTNEGGREHLVSELIAPNQRQSGKPYLFNKYVNGKVAEQFLAGHKTELQYGAGWADVIDPRTVSRRFTLEQKPAGYVIAGLQHPGAGSQPLATVVTHNDDGQVLRTRLPKRNAISYRYDTANEPAAGVESPIRNDMGPASITSVARSPGTSVLQDLQGGGIGGVIYHNNLSKGNLLEIVRESYDSDDEPISTTTTYDPLYNRVKSSRGERGFVTSYSIGYAQGGTEGNPLSVILPSFVSQGVTHTPAHSYRYNEYGQRVEERDILGNRKTFSYHSSGAVSAIWFPNGEYQSSVYDARGNAIEETFSAQAKRAHKYSLADRLEETVVDPDGYKIKTTFYHDANGNVVESRAERRDVFSAGAHSLEPRSYPDITRLRKYDIMNRATQVTTSDGWSTFVEERSYDAVGNLVSLTRPATDGRTLTTSYHYDADNRSILTEVGRFSSSAEYDDNGNQVSVKDANGHVSRYAYDGFDRLVKTTSPGGGVMAYEYDAGDNILLHTVFDERQRKLLKKEEYEYDEHGRIRRHIVRAKADGKSPADMVTEHAYNVLGRRVSTTGPGGSETTYGYDAIGRKIKITDALGNVLQRAFDDRGRLTGTVETSVEPGLGANDTVTMGSSTWRINYTYDDLFNVIEEDRYGATTQYFYDSAGNPRGKLDASGLTLERVFDGFRRPTRQITPAENLQFVYDKGFLATKQVYGGDTVHELEYDQYGRKVAETQNGLRMSYRYDAQGNRTKVINPDGSVVVTHYTSANLPKTRCPEGKAGECRTGAWQEQMTYDGLGRLLSSNRTSANGETKVEREYLLLGPLASETQTLDGDSQEVLYSYDVQSNTTLLDYPEAVEHFRVRQDVDPLGRPSRVRVKPSLSAPEHTTTYHWAGVDRLAIRQLGDTHVQTWRYDGRKRPNRSQIMLSASAGRQLVWNEQQRFSQGWLSESLETSVAIDAQTPQIAKVLNFTYDPLGRIAATQFRQSVQAPGDDELVHTMAVTRNAYDDDGRIRQVLNSFGSYTSDTGFAVAGLTGVQQMKSQAYAYDDSGVAGTRTHLLKSDQSDLGESGVPSSAQFNQTLADSGCGDTLYCETNTVERNANGNIVRDAGFDYEYDELNRLVRATDRILATWQVDSEVRFTYDALGRLVAKRFRSGKAPQLHKHFKRSDQRYLYTGNNIIVDINLDTGTPAAAYVWGTRPDELLAVFAADGDAPARSYFVHSRMNGGIVGVSDELALRQVVSQPYFTGESGYWQATREERFISGTNIRMPYHSGAQRSFEYLRLNKKDGVAPFSFSYNITPHTDLRIYAQDNLADIVEKVKKHHPRPEVLDVIEGVFAGTIGLVALPEAALLSALAGAISVGMDAGINVLFFGNDYSLGDAAKAFGTGTLGGGLAGGAHRMVVGLTGARWAGGVAAFISEASTGSALDIAAYGNDPVAALLSNYLGGAVLGVAAPRLVAALARKLGPGLSPMQQTRAFRAALDQIAWLASPDGGNMRVAKLFLEDFAAGNIETKTFYRSHRSVDKAEALQYSADNSDTIKIWLVPEAADGAYGLAIPGRTGEFNGKSGVIVLDPISTSFSRDHSGFLAATLLHEFAHQKGARELQAHHIDAQVAVALGLHQHPRLRNAVAREVGGMHRYIRDLDRAGTFAERAAVIQARQNTLTRRYEPGFRERASDKDELWEIIHEDFSYSPAFWDPDLSEILFDNELTVIMAPRLNGLGQ